MKLLDTGIWILRLRAHNKFNFRQIVFWLLTLGRCRNVHSLLIPTTPQVLSRWGVLTLLALTNRCYHIRKVQRIFFERELWALLETWGSSRSRWKTPSATVSQIPLGRSLVFCFEQGNTWRIDDELGLYLSFRSSVFINEEVDLLIEKCRCAFNVVLQAGTVVYQRPWCPTTVRRPKQALRE